MACGAGRIFLVDGAKKSRHNQRKEAREVTVCGIVGWRRKLERRQKKGQNQFMEAEETLEKRTRDKLLEKTNWYKTNMKRKAEDEESQFQYNPTMKRRKRMQADNKNKNNKSSSSKAKVKSVMFVPFTRHSELATRLRENEEQMEKMTGYRMKIVERGGTKLVDILHKANPWAGEDCDRKGCLLCTTKRMEGKTNTQDCRKRNCVYETTCLTCKERADKRIEERMVGMDNKRIDEEKKKVKSYIYIGETNRSVYERGLEHVRDIAACKTSSHMLRHLLDVHEEEEEEWHKIRFGMKIVRSIRSAFERHILESVIIQKKRHYHHLMNNKAEYNRCALPRLTAKLGEKDLDKWRESDRQEMAKEASIEEKIRNRKKEKAKKRGAASRRMDKGQPSRKKRRIEIGEEDKEEGQEEELKRQEGEEETDKYINTNKRKIPPLCSPKKRKVQQEDKERRRSPKKMRNSSNIKRYITCRRWREEEDDARRGEIATHSEGEGEEGQGQEVSHILSWGKRLDTTLALPGRVIYLET